MRKFRGVLLLTVAFLAGGCAGVKKQGVAVNDPLDAVRIEQMTGNHVSGAMFERTVVCLNARRETRWLTAVTNQSVAVLTNVSLTWVTNVTISLATNQQQTVATNLVAAPTALASDTNVEAHVLAAAPPASTNIAVTTASNLTQARSPGQTVTTANFQTQTTRQCTTSEKNLSITTAENQLITRETNVVVTVLTNVALTSATNLTVTLTNVPVREHFLVLEYTPPPDFSLAPGESLVLLVDGARHALAPATTQSVLVPRRGFSAVAYRATPQLLVEVANARQVKLRIKGTSQVIERQMKTASRMNLKKFLVKYFSPAQSDTVSANELRPAGES